MLETTMEQFIDQDLMNDEVYEDQLECYFRSTVQ